MKRLRYIWAAFGLCLAVVLVAMAWISFTALRLERVEAQANRRAAVGERIRLALWRMESALTPLVTRESTGRTSPTPRSIRSTATCACSPRSGPTKSSCPRRC